MPPADFPWTDDHIERLRVLHAEGKTATAIGHDLGCSRNAVIGKIYRLGLRRPNADNHGHRAAKRGRPKRRNGGRYAAMLDRIGDRTNGHAQPTTQVEHFDASEAATMCFSADGPRLLVELHADECRWPLGHPSDSDFGFCGASIVAVGVSYCARHASIAYRVLPPRRLR